MNKILVFGLIAVLCLVGVASVAAQPPTVAVTMNQAQFQWRAWSTFGDWSYVYQNYETSTDYRLTGKVLHMAFSYSPVVTDLEGESSIYVYDKQTDLWIQREGTISYKYEPYYGDYPIVNYFRGYLEFDGAPSDANFVHGVAYQWVYLYAPQEVTPLLPNAVWDETMGAWLVGFSIYLWDSGTQGYDITSPYEDPAFPDPFIKPVPASDYNPLDL